MKNATVLNRNRECGRPRSAPGSTAIVAAAGMFAVALLGGAPLARTADEHGGQNEHEKSEVILTAEQVNLAEIKTVTATVGEIHVEILRTGEVALNEDRLAHIVPRVSGVVQEVRNGLGDDVHAGDVMAVLESSDLGDAKADFIEKKRELELAQVDTVRARTIHDNTVKMLDFLKALPSLESLKTMGDLDLGENRGLLISAYSKLVSAKSDVGFAKSDLEFSKGNHLREKGLYEKKISSENDYLKAANEYRRAESGYKKTESEYEKAEAEFHATCDGMTFAVTRSLLDNERAVNVAQFSLRASERKLYVLGLDAAAIQSLRDGNEASQALARYAIQAPFDGTVIEKHVAQGEQIDAGAAVYKLCDLTTVWCIASVYEKDIARVKQGQTASLDVKAYPDLIFSGRVTWISDLIDEETRTLKIRIELGNKDRLLKPGMFAQVALGVDTKKDVLLVSSSSVQTQEGETVVFVDEGGGRFARREVTIGVRSTATVEILDGVREGEEVVTHGSFLLRSEFEKGDFGAGHGH